MYIDVDLLKRHLNIDSEFTEDDDYLELLIDVAEKTVQRNICCVLADMEDGDGQIPSPLRQAILLYCGVLYNSRESVTYGGSPVEVPYTFNYLIGLYKNYSDTTSDEFIDSVLDDLARITELVDTNEEIAQGLGNRGDLVVNNELRNKAVERIASSVTIDEDGNMTVDIERI